MIFRTQISVVLIQIFLVTFSHSEKQNYENSNSPPEDRGQQDNKFIPKITGTSCTSQTNFCEEVDDYPEEYIEKNLGKEVEKFKYMLWVDVGDDTDESTKIDEGEFFCSSKSTLKYPRVAFNTKDQWKYIYNNEKHKQGVRVVRCQREESSCIMISRFKTICKQIFSNRSMLAISYNGSLEIDTFNQPVTCCCSLKYTSSWNFSQ